MISIRELRTRNAVVARDVVITIKICKKNCLLAEMYQTVNGESAIPVCLPPNETCRSTSNYKATVASPLAAQTKQ